MRIESASAIAAALLVMALNAAPASAQVATAVLRRQLEFVRASSTVEIAGVTVDRSSGLVELYERSGSRALWTDARAVDELERAIRLVEVEGLRPEDYHVAEVAALTAAAQTPLIAAQLDLLRTHALIQLTHDVHFGRAASLRPLFAAASEDRYASTFMMSTIDRMIGTGRIAAEIRALRPDHFVYDGLAGALADLRQIERAGGWQPVPPGRALARDSVDVRVPLLRSRLAAERYNVMQGVTDPHLFDALLDAAVRLFQHRHALNEDGVVGPATLAELNVPVAKRIEQVRINLERARWITHDLPATFLAVNVAGGTVYLVRDGVVVFESRAVVGTTNHTTPIFRASMTHMELNPTWTVPPSMVGDVLASARRDAGYLRRNGFRVLDHNGRAVDASGIDFARYSARTFPYAFRQEPGPTNPLGRIKFMFPNRYNVYLHDTAAPHLFEQEDRTFSRGCIRVRDPVRLAELLPGHAWTRPEIEATMDEGRTRTIPLDAPVPVLILYWTASADLHGELHYYRDLYQRDAVLLRELDRHPHRR